MNCLALDFFYLRDKINLSQFYLLIRVIRFCISITTERPKPIWPTCLTQYHAMHRHVMTEPGRRHRTQRIDDCHAIRSTCLTNHGFGSDDCRSRSYVGPFASSRSGEERRGEERSAVSLAHIFRCLLFVHQCGYKLRSRPSQQFGSQSLRIGANARQDAGERRHEPE